MSLTAGVRWHLLNSLNWKASVTELSFGLVTSNCVEHITTVFLFSLRRNSPHQEVLLPQSAPLYALTSCNEDQYLWLIHMKFT